MLSDDPTVEVQAGTTRRLRMLVRRPDGTPLDLTGGTAVWRLSRHSRAAPEDALLTKPGVVDIETIGGTTFWTVTIDLAETDTDGLDPGLLWHECKVRKGDSVYPVWAGPFVLKPSTLRSGDLA